MNSIPSHGVCGYMSWLYVLEALQNEHRQVSISFKEKKKKKNYLSSLPQFISKMGLKWLLSIQIGISN